MGIPLWVLTLAGAPDERLIVHFMNLFHEIVSPEIETPRDVFRFINAFSVTWPAVAGDVDLGDFVALEAYRLFRPAIHQAIRANQAMVCGSPYAGRDKEAGSKADAALLSSEPDVERFRRGIMRLFPMMEGVWSNVMHSRDASWARQRRACSSDNFASYFRLSISDDVAPKSLIDEYLTHAGDTAWVSSALIAAAAERKRDGGSRVPAILGALQLHADEIRIENAEPLLSGVFAVADHLDIDGDRARGFEIGSNRLRMHWLLRALLMERTTLAQRSAILMRAVEGAGLGWCVDLAVSAWEDYHPREGKEPEPETACLLTEKDAGRQRLFCAFPCG